MSSSALTNASLLQQSLSVVVIAITTTGFHKEALLFGAEEDIAMYRHPFVKAYIGRGKGEREDKRKTYTA